MLAIILVIILSLLISFLTTLDSSSVNLRFGDTVFSGIPLFYVVFIAVLVGAILASVKTIINLITAKLTIMSKNSDLKKSYKSSENLQTKIDELEEKNLRLKDQIDELNNKKKE